MAGFFLYISNTTFRKDYHLCFHEIQRVKGTPSEDQRINCSVHGRYVVYYNERLSTENYPSYFSDWAFYELCELEVYGNFFFTSNNEIIYYTSVKSTLVGKTCYKNTSTELRAFNQWTQ